MPTAWRVHWVSALAMPEHAEARSTGTTPYSKELTIMFSLVSLFCWLRSTDEPRRQRHDGEGKGNAGSKLNKTHQTACQGPGTGQGSGACP